MGEPPEDDGAVGAGADEGAAVGAQLDAGDAAAVSLSHVSDHTLHVVPHLHQVVVSSCDGLKKKKQERKKRIQFTGSSKNAAMKS